MTSQGADKRISRSGVEIKVCGSSKSRAKKRCKRGRSRQVVGKLDEVQVQWIVHEKRNGEMTNKQIAELRGISVGWVKKLWAKYRHTNPTEITYPARMGRPRNGLPGRREHSAILSTVHNRKYKAVRLEKAIEKNIGIHITHHVIHSILMDEELVENNPAKAKQRKWIRYERRFSNSMWHTDYKQLHDGRWFISF